MQKMRRWVQVLWIFLTNGFWAFPWTGNLYQGPLKVICSPGLNCYSCPAATTYCPIGALQQLLLGFAFRWSRAATISEPLGRLDGYSRGNLSAVHLRLGLPLRTLPGAAPQDPLEKGVHPVCSVREVPVPGRLGLCPFLSSRVTSSRLGAKPLSSCQSLALHSPRRHSLKLGGTPNGSP